MIYEKPNYDCGEKLYWLMRTFRNIACGCSLHPSYRAKRKPTTDCSRCKDMWSLSQGITEKYGDWFI